MNGWTPANPRRRSPSQTPTTSESERASETPPPPPPQRRPDLPFPLEPPQTPPSFSPPPLSATRYFRLPLASTSFPLLIRTPTHPWLPFLNGILARAPAQSLDDPDSDAAPGHCGTFTRARAHANNPIADPPLVAKDIRRVVLVGRDRRN